MAKFLRFLGLIALLLVGGCTVAGGTGSRFERTGFPGFFEPGATVILDTETGMVYVIGGGSMVDGALAAALRRPSRSSTVSGALSSSDSNSAADADAEAEGGKGGNNGNHGHGNGHGEDEDD